MIDPLISAIVTVLSWIISVIADIAYFFSRVAYYAGQIPGVGSYLSAFFTSIQAAFNDFGYDVVHFSTRLQNVLNAIDDWLDKVKNLWDQVFGWISDKLDDAYTWASQALSGIAGLVSDIADLWDAIPSFSEIFTWIMNSLGITKKSGESWIQAVTRTIVGWISSIPFPSIDSFFTWLLSPLGITKRSGESWIQAITRTIVGWISSIPFPSVNDFFTWLLSPLGITKGSNESWWDAIIRTIISTIPGLAGIVNFWSFWWTDMNDFFSDPADYFAKRLERLGAPFAERLWDFVEKILERIW